MTELKLPLDFERLPEFWQLAEALRNTRSTPVSEPELNETAVLLWMRLWIVLGYLARTTNRPGWLNAPGQRQLNQAFRQFGEDCPPVEILIAGTLLRRGNDGCYCDLFTATNRHLAGDHLTKEERGNRRSLPARNKNVIAHEAFQQSQLLPAEVFRKRDGQAMIQREIDRSMVLIITLDRCLKQRARFKSNFTEGLLADAHQVIETTPQEELDAFYGWLAEKWDHPAVPKSADEILRDWDRIFQTSKGENHG
jgi:hypothetical protein